MSDDFVSAQKRTDQIIETLDEAIRKAKADLDQMCEEYSLDQIEGYEETMVRDWVLVLGLMKFGDGGRPEHPVMTMMPFGQADYVGRGLLAEGDLHLEAGTMAFYESLDDGDAQD